MSRELSYAPLDADGQVPLDRLDNAPGSHPDLATHDALGLATDAELATHAADTTSVHGITDTAVMATDAEVATAVSDHSADTTAVHGITDTAALSLDTHDHDADYEAAGGIATHAGLADPHTGYQKESEKSAVSGYASLDAGTKVPIAELPTGTSGTTVALGDAAAGLITTHEGAANPHPTYETSAEAQAKVDVHTGDAADAHDASAVSVVPAGAIVATDVQAALEELDTEKSATAHTHTHAATTGQTVDDHHARDHAIDGSTHTGTLDDAQIPAGIARDAEVAAAYQPLDSDLTAIAALTTTAFGRGLLALADAAALGAAHTHAGGLTLTAIVKDLGVSRRSGTFDITGLAGLAADKPVLVMQTAAPITSKGDARDEMEFDAIQASGYVVDATTIRVYWNAPGVVVGDYAFGYTVSG